MDASHEDKFSIFFFVMRSSFVFVVKVLSGVWSARAQLPSNAVNSMATGDNAFERKTTIIDRDIPIS